MRSRRYFGFVALALTLSVFLADPAGAETDARRTHDIEVIIRARWAHEGPGEADRAVRVFRCESGLSPTARNRRSTAFGVAQFLASTWRSTGIARTTNPWLQIEAAHRLYRARRWSPWLCARQRRGH